MIQHHWFYTINMLHSIPCWWHITLMWSSISTTVLLKKMALELSAESRICRAFGRKELTLTALFDLYFKGKIKAMLGVQRGSVNRIIHTTSFSSKLDSFLRSWGRSGGLVAQDASYLMWMPQKWPDELLIPGTSSRIDAGSKRYFFSFNTRLAHINISNVLAIYCP